MSRASFGRQALAFDRCARRSLMRLPLSGTPSGQPGTRRQIRCAAARHFAVLGTGRLPGATGRQLCAPACSACAFLRCPPRLHSGRRRFRPRRVLAASATRKLFKWFDSSLCCVPTTISTRPVLFQRRLVSQARRTDTSLVACSCLCWQKRSGQSNPAKLSGTPGRKTSARARLCLTTVTCSWSLAFPDSLCPGRANIRSLAQTAAVSACVHRVIDHLGGSSFTLPRHRVFCASGRQPAQHRSRGRSLACFSSVIQWHLVMGRKA